MNSETYEIIELDESYRNQLIELMNQFYNKVNNLTLDGLFKIKKHAASKMADIYFKLKGTDKILLAGIIEEKSNELISILIARTEDKPFLEEEKTLFIDLAVTKIGKSNQGFMTALLDYTYSWAKERNFQSIELRAITANEDAVKFWQKKGYTDFYIRFRKRL